MKCLHCRQGIFAWQRTCKNCGAAISKSILNPPPGVSTTAKRDLATPLAVMALRSCDCFKRSGPSAWAETRFHSEMQDTQSEGWIRLLELVEIAAADGREEFAPFHGMPIEAQTQVITLPSTIGKLKSVRRLLLHRSFLVRIPPEIGDMENLVEFKPYTSDCLHWFPYEITRCAKLDESLVNHFFTLRQLQVTPAFSPPGNTTAVHSQSGPGESSTRALRLFCHHHVQRVSNAPRPDRIASGVGLPERWHRCAAAASERLLAGLRGTAAAGPDWLRV